MVRTFAHRFGPVSNKVPGADAVNDETAKACLQTKAIPSTPAKDLPWRSIAQAKAMMPAAAWSCMSRDVEEMSERVGGGASSSSVCEPAVRQISSGIVSRPDKL